MTRSEIIAEYIATYYGDEFNLKRELKNGDRMAFVVGSLISWTISQKMEELQNAKE